LALMSSGAGKGPISKNRIEKSILLLRGRKVMLDADLASLYEVETRVLVQAVKRNLDRFPDDFMFQLTKEEFDLLRSQAVSAGSWRLHLKTRSRSVSRVDQRRSNPQAIPQCSLEITDCDLKY